ncbi:Monopolin complex subunit pcs1 [Neolecta irregularis DAH-3]|uniref:Monopolin complex subunit pcs1 n=1 Tax=Neolecta irregularis (strain DAH-3) TaxID=1198029 RepID=A0A1U7LNV1_NEOID|nr:Monopolin complex subunit pcs1 [Neolecta irregularis DAH-3]|eukprot:OLL24222.1 Monopolin complex subunit pcs1 [Neolecta irregularis DAH-3]
MGRPKKTSIMSMAESEEEEIEDTPEHAPKTMKKSSMITSKAATKKRESGESDEDLESTVVKKPKNPIRKRTNISKPVIAEEGDMGIISEPPRKPIARAKKAERKDESEEEQEPRKSVKKAPVKKAVVAKGKTTVPEPQIPMDIDGSEEDLAAQRKKAAPIRGRKGKNLKEVAETQLPPPDKTSDEEIEDLEVPRPKPGKHVASVKQDDESTKLEELRAKYTMMENRYNTLKQLKETETEKNFAKYKKLSEQRFQASDEVIKSLEAQVVSKSAVTEDIKTAKKASKAEKAEIQNLQNQVSSLREELLQTKNTLQIATAKLANRKENNGSTGLSGFKEDLYADLTGLIIRDVKHSPEKTIYDCIQTGRNRTIHFKLSLNNTTNQTEYVPLLDTNRDKQLIDLLPDYLVEEIQFDRDQAGSFFHRLCGVLQKKVEVEVDVED